MKSLICGLILGLCATFSAYSSADAQVVVRVGRPVVVRQYYAPHYYGPQYYHHYGNYGRPVYRRSYSGPDGYHEYYYTPTPRGEVNVGRGRVRIAW